MLYHPQSVDDKTFIIHRLRMIIVAMATAMVAAMVAAMAVAMAVAMAAAMAVAMATIIIINLWMINVLSSTDCG